MPEFTWLPANQATAEDVEAVFAGGGARKCRCQALKVPGWIWRDSTQDQRDAALLQQTGCGTAGPTSGLIGYVDGQAAGWVAVEPRENYPRIWSRKQPWMRMDPELEGVWSVTCFVVRKGHRKLGLTYELAAATVEYGEQVGARVLEGYDGARTGQDRDLGRGVGGFASGVPRGRLRGDRLAHTATPCGAPATRQRGLTPVRWGRSPYGNRMLADANRAPYRPRGIGQLSAGHLATIPGKIFPARESFDQRES